MIRPIAIAAGIAVLAAQAGPASAKGCIKGAIMGAVAGHYAGHHAFLGAAAGCAAGRDYARWRSAPQTNGQGTTNAKQINEPDMTTPGRPDAVAPP
jgi:hypothetical protein